MLYTDLFFFVPLRRWNFEPETSKISCLTNKKEPICSIEIRSIFPINPAEDTRIGLAPVGPFNVKRMSNTDRVTVEKIPTLFHAYKQEQDYDDGQAVRRCLFILSCKKGTTVFMDNADLLYSIGIESGKIQFHNADTRSPLDMDEETNLIIRMNRARSYINVSGYKGNKIFLFDGIQIITYRPSRQ